MKKYLVILFIAFLFIACNNKEKITGEAKTLQYGLVIDNNLRIRNNPDINSEIIGILNFGDFIEIYQTSENIDSIDGMENYWYKIDPANSDHSGWVYGGYVYAANTIEELIAYKETNTLQNEEEKTAALIDFEKYILLTNCTITKNFLVPSMDNRIIGINDDEAPWELIKKNEIRYIFDGIQIQLTPENGTHKKIFLHIKNSKNEFYKELNLLPVKNFDNENIFGYYENIKIENKFWLDDGNPWIFQIKSGENKIFETELKLGLINSLLFKEIHDTPFSEDNLTYVSLNEEYTFRCQRENTDLIVIYFSPDYGEYKPVLYLLPENIDENGVIDIKITWSNSILKGIYCFGTYKFDNLPKERKTHVIFDFIGVR